MTYFISVTVYPLLPSGRYDPTPLDFHDRFISRLKSESVYALKERVAKYVQKTSAESLGLEPSKVYVHFNAFNQVQ